MDEYIPLKIGSNDEEQFGESGLIRFATQSSFAELFIEKITGRILRINIISITDKSQIEIFEENLIIQGLVGCKQTACISINDAVAGSSIFSPYDIFQNFRIQMFKNAFVINFSIEKKSPCFLLTESSLLNLVTDIDFNIQEIISFGLTEDEQKSFKWYCKNI